LIIALCFPQTPEGQALPMCLKNLVVSEPLQTNHRSCAIRPALNPRQYERQLRLEISTIVARIGLHEIDADVGSRVVLLLSRG
jgi:hypothetical protein